MCVDLFFFKQKTAYDMRIIDWSSDVCSSDLLVERRRGWRRLADLEMPQGAAEEAERMCRSLAIEEARAAVRGQGERNLDRRARPARRDRAGQQRHRRKEDRKSVGSGKSASVRVEFGGRRINNKKKNTN